MAHDQYSLLHSHPTTKNRELRFQLSATFMPMHAYV
jgi:hypothetical protein